MSLRSQRNKLARISRRFDNGSIITSFLRSRRIRNMLVNFNNERLNRGVDKNGSHIRTFASRFPNVYADSTIDIKIANGQPHTIVTLKDTGAFRRTIDVVYDRIFFTITANFRKDDGDISDNVDIDNILGMSEDQSKILISELRDHLISSNKRTLGL